MTTAWKTEAEQRLMESTSPPVLTTAMLRTLALAGHTAEPSRATFTRWVAALSESGKLREVIKGVYLNLLGHRDASPAAAADWVRSRSVVSLSWVLEQAHITNNFGDTITCIIPTDPDWPNPQIGDRATSAGTFRFFAMPAALMDERAGRLEDLRDLRFSYARATPEKALLDWIYLGDSRRSRMTPPPLDLDIAALSMPRLKRVAKGMGITPLLDAWLQRYGQYQQDEDVRENAATRMRF